MNRLALLVKNRQQYQIDDYKFNLKIIGNTRIRISNEYKKSYRNINFITLNWHDYVKEYTNNKDMFAKILSDEIHPRLYEKNEILDEVKYFVKPKKGSCGDDISVMKGREIKNNLDDKKFLIQRYIKPDLINERKYDVRIYYFVIKYNNFFNTWYSRNGKIRLCSQLYKKGGEITNSSLLDRKTDLSKLQGHLYNLLENDRNNIFKLMTKVNEQFRKILMSTKIDFVNMYGLDLIQDENQNWYIIEANGNPNWQNDSDTNEIRKIKTDIFDEILKILAMRFYHANYKLDNWIQLE